MIEVFGWQPFVSTGNVVTWTLIIAVAAMWWIRGIPDRQRAKNEEKVIDNAEVALRFKEWRTEVHGMKNELAKVQAQLHESNAQRARNRDRFNMVLFILRLVMAELRRLDPESPVIKQADALLKQVTDEEDEHSPAVTAAEVTVVAAKNTLEEVKNAEGGGK